MGGLRESRGDSWSSRRLAADGGTRNASRQAFSAGVVDDDAPGSVGLPADDLDTMEVRRDRLPIRAWNGTAALCSRERDRTVGTWDRGNRIELTRRVGCDHALQNLADCGVTRDNLLGRHHESGIRLVEGYCCIEIPRLYDLEQEQITLACVYPLTCSRIVVGDEGRSVLMFALESRGSMVRASHQGAEVVERRAARVDMKDAVFP